MVYSLLFEFLDFFYIIVFVYLSSFALIIRTCTITFVLLKRLHFAFLVYSVKKEHNVHINAGIDY